MLRSNSPVDVLDSYTCFFLHFLSLSLLSFRSIISVVTLRSVPLHFFDFSGEWVGGQSETGLIIYMFA